MKKTTSLKSSNDESTSEVKHYKFRAECETDVNRLRKRIGTKCHRIIKDIGMFPDTEVDLYTTMSLDDVRNEMRKIPDGHVMLQTIALAENYTGERDEELE